MRRLAVLLAALAALPAAARAQQLPGDARPPATPPLLCRGGAFVDVVGRGSDDALTAPDRAARLWGLGGDDALDGSGTRASCLLGGRGDDVLALNGGGGVAYGDAGRDTVSGSGLGDVVRGGPGTDAVAAGGGDDKLFMRDNGPEVVDCGGGDDQVKADRADVLIRCESTNLAGRSLRTTAVRPRSPRLLGAVSFRLRLQAARAGAYRVAWVDRCRTPGLRELGRLRVRVRPPRGGWCRGRNRLVVLRAGARDRPERPVARLAFTARRAR